MNHSRDVKEFIASGGKITRCPDAITRTYYENLKIMGIIDKEIRRNGVERERTFFGANSSPDDEFKE